MLGPLLRSESIHLAPMRLEDLPLVNHWWAMPEVTRFWGGVGAPSLHRTKEWYERASSSETEVVWSLELRGRTIGHCFIGGIDWRNRHATSGLLIGEIEFWRRGYASQAVKMRTRYAIEELGLERLESESVDANVGMHRALEKSGYVTIGRKRHVFYRGGVWHDSFLFELLKEDWRA